LSRAVNSRAPMGRPSDAINSPSVCLSANRRSSPMRFDPVGFDAPHERAHDAASIATALGETYELGAFIRRVVDALHVAAFFELVDQRAHRLLGDARGAGELGGARTFGYIPQRPHRGRVCGWKVGITCA